MALETTTCVWCGKAFTPALRSQRACCHWHLELAVARERVQRHPLPCTDGATVRPIVYPGGTTDGKHTPGSHAASCQGNGSVRAKSDCSERGIPPQFEWIRMDDILEGAGITIEL